MGTSREDIACEWKQKYTEALIDALKPSGNTLEIGFGKGFGAEAIQKHHPKALTIIEADQEVFEKAKKWGANRPNTTIIKGEWKEVLPKLNKFDAIFFNDYAHDEQEISIINFLFPEDARKSLEEAKKLIGMLEEQMVQSKSQFSDKEIEDFYKKVGQFYKYKLPFFFKRLKENGNITDSQYKNCVKKYQLDSQETGRKSPLSLTDKSEMLECLELCLKNHMVGKSRFSCFLNNQISKYEDSDFFDRIITNPDIDYKESSISIKLADKPRDALIMIVEKM
jgi:hypothetical protein